MANPVSSLSETTNSQTAHRSAHHAFAFQQVLSAVTHALARKEQPRRAAVSQQTQRRLDKQRTAASATGSWAELLLR